MGLRRRVVDALHRGLDLVVPPPPAPLPPPPPRKHQRGTSRQLNPDNLPHSKHPITYDSDGLVTVNGADFLSDPRFVRSYAAGMGTGSRHGPDLHIEWRMHVICWAAEHAKALDADYVECGCYTGTFTRTAIDYVDFAAQRDRKWYLFDTFEGIPLDRLTAAEQVHADSFASKNERLYQDFYELTKQTFARFENVVLIRGRVPESLAEVEIPRVGYLSIDMNSVEPEVGALRHFWSKLVPGGVVVLDDYNFPGHGEQKAGIDALGRELGFGVLALPTGQGLIVKP